jgi:hypothetical protein
VADNFRTKQKRIGEALDQVDSTLSEAVASLDDLPTFMINGRMQCLPDGTFLARVRRGGLSEGLPDDPRSPFA